MVLLQNKGDDSRRRGPSFPLLQVDLQGKAGGAERRERSGSKHTDNENITGQHSGFNTKPCVYTKVMFFFVSATKAFEDDHPVLTDHRQKELIDKRSLYQ